MNVHSIITISLSQPEVLKAIEEYIYRKCEFNVEGNVRIIYNQYTPATYDMGGYFEQFTAEAKITSNDKVE